MTRSLNSLLAFTILMHVSTLACAQPIPPACAQYVTLLRSCWPDVIHQLELTNPVEAEKKKATQPPADQVEGAIRRAIASDGSLTVAQRCASPEMKSRVLGHMIDQVLIPLSMTGSLGPACAASMQSFR